MKGYIFSLQCTDPQQVLSRGIHGVRMTRGTAWSGSMLGTLADHTTIRPGDLLFCFQDRNIYGIGRVVNPFSPTV
jgi:hypothetical protein